MKLTFRRVIEWIKLIKPLFNKHPLPKSSLSLSFVRVFALKNLSCVLFCFEEFWFLISRSIRNPWILVVVNFYLKPFWFLSFTFTPFLFLIFTNLYSDSYKYGSFYFLSIFRGGLEAWMMGVCQGSKPSRHMRFSLFPLCF